MHAICFIGRALFHISPRFVTFLHEQGIASPLALGLGVFISKVRRL